MSSRKHWSISCTIMEYSNKIQQEMWTAMSLRKSLLGIACRHRHQHTIPVAILAGDFNSTSFKLLVDEARKGSKDVDSSAPIILSKLASLCHPPCSSDTTHTFQMASECCSMTELLSLQATLFLLHSQTQYQEELL